LYFSSKGDLFRVMLRDALHDMRILADDFPVVTPNDAGRTALRGWVRRFCAVYEAHATVLRIVSQAEIAGEDVWQDGLRMLFRLAEAIAQGMTAAARVGRPAAAGGRRPEHAELTAVACLMMLERVSYLLGAGARLPRAEMADRLTAIIYAAFSVA
jgi:AcrR family transcriptional regulator